MKILFFIFSGIFGGWLERIEEQVVKGSVAKF